MFGTPGFLANSYCFDNNEKYSEIQWRKIVTVMQLMDINGLIESVKIIRIFSIMA